ncbi:MAG: zinc ribbon domain-containing protein [Nocardioidaceae bacterium]
MQLRLLDLQQVDATVDQLAHRLRTLPSQAELTRLTERHDEVADQHGRALTAVDDLAREQRKADADVEQVKARRTRDRQRIDQGVISDPRQLQAMQHEVETLDRRISDLEDTELEVMERLEQAQTSRDELGSELSEIQVELQRVRGERDAAATDIARQADHARAERDLLVADLPEVLLALYDKLRAQLGGVAVGALHQRRCGGCRLDIGAAEMARIATAPSDEVLRCEECNRILVRTPESGVAAVVSSEPGD